MLALLQLAASDYCFAIGIYHCQLLRVQQLEDFALQFLFSRHSVRLLLDDGPLHVIEM